MHKLAQCLNLRFPGGGLQSAYRLEIQRVCSEFMASGLADSKFKAEITSQSDSKFWSCVSEALIYDRIKKFPRPDRANIGKGPDFLLSSDSKRVWVEVICPEPIGLPEDCLEIKANRNVPHTEILLRWTSAIKEKTDKLIGSLDGRVKGYLNTGVVNQDDVYVVVVNGCRLRHGPFPALHGISQFPYAVEAVFPVGPMQFRFDRDSLKSCGHAYQERYHISKTNGSQVPTYTFLDPRHSAISAIWAVDFDAGRAIGGHEPSALIHNPLATQPLPQGFFEADSEFVASQSGEDYVLSRL